MQLFAAHVYDNVDVFGVVISHNEPRGGQWTNDGLWFRMPCRGLNSPSSNDIAVAWRRRHRRRRQLAMHAASIAAAAALPTTVAAAALVAKVNPVVNAPLQPPSFSSSSSSKLRLKAIQQT